MSNQHVYSNKVGGGRTLFVKKLSGPVALIQKRWGERSDVFDHTPNVDPFSRCVEVVLELEEICSG